MFLSSRLMCVLTLGAMALSAQTIPAETVHTTAMIGIATGQTARLNLLNPGVLPPAVGLLCTAEVTYYDGAGNVKKSASVAVAPGTSQFVDLHSDTDLALAPATRAEIRATVAMPGILPPSNSSSTTSSTSGACKLIATLEIFDSITGRTQALTGKVEAVGSVSATPDVN
ncbi:MAG TPA: hypothetical protein VMB03_02220 [Bryobacteraceae bacterium]|nr:hypothetical protein [Bryobacteraceae bacterium]